MMDLDQVDCPHCDGLGWHGETQAECCNNSNWECGGRGCTGPEPVHVQVQCQACDATGVVAIRSQSDQEVKAK